MVPLFQAFPVLVRVELGPRMRPCAPWTGRGDWVRIAMSRLPHLPYKPPSFCPRQGGYRPPSLFRLLQSLPKEDHTEPALHKCREGLQAGGSPQPAKRRCWVDARWAGRPPGLNREKKRPTQQAVPVICKGLGTLRSGDSGSHA